MKLSKIEDALGICPKCHHPLTRKILRKQKSIGLKTGFITLLVFSCLSIYSTLFNIITKYFNPHSIQHWLGITLTIVFIISTMIVYYRWRKFETSLHLGAICENCHTTWIAD